MADVDEMVGRPEPVAPDDWRVGLAAELVADGGTVLGKAVILSPSIAVTTASVAGRAETALRTPSNANVASVSLGLVFPQFSGPSSYPLPASILGVDEGLRFAVIGFSGQLPVSLPSSLLGTGELPADRAECSVVYADDPLKGFFRIPGQVENRPGGSFVLYVDRLPSDSSQLMGTPVFFEDRLIGIVVGGPSRSVANTFLLGVTSVRGMALSAAGSAVRALLPWIPDESRVPGPESLVGASPSFAQNAKSGPFAETRAQDTQGPSTRSGGASLVGDFAQDDRSTSPLLANAARSGAPSGTPLVDGVLGAETFARLSPAARSALERAEGMRVAMGLKEIHMEQLVMGLFERQDGPTRRLLARSKIDGPGLSGIIREVSDTKIPSSYSPFALNALPPFSEHASKSLQAAARRSAEQKTRNIESEHLLYGALSVDECELVRALLERGVRKEDIATVLKDDPAVEGASGVAALTGTREPSNDEMFRRLSASSRAALGRAEALRGRQDKVHMEHLIAGLFDKLGGPTYRLFQSEKIDRTKLMRIVREAVGTEIPDGYRAIEIKALPAMSTHVRQALDTAARLAETSGLIRSRHLLYGALSIENCKMIEALKALGVSKERLALYDEEADVDEDSSMSPSAAPLVANLKVETKIEGSAVDIGVRGGAGTRAGVSAPQLAAPTPKVDSDLWSEQDRLGYEAYARTIAALITHKETVPPLTIGIKAPWGAGKTSLMKRVQHLLDGRAELSEENRSGARVQGQAPKMTLRELLRELKQITKADKGTLKPGEMAKLPVPANKEGAERYGLPPRITVWFNAWKYQTSEQIWAGMAHCIISQVTARMTPLERELFWLRLHARRINTDEVRRQVHEVLLRSLVPVALIAVVVCAIVIWVASLAPLTMPYQWSVRVVTALAGLIGVIWKARDTLGEKAAGTMKELVREPDYEGKMGYLHLVESDIREVLNLVTEASPAASPESRVASPEAKSASVAHDGKSPLLAKPARPFDFAQGKNGAPGTPERTNASAATQTPLVVFVDDLDRCAPNKVAEVVEAINLFLCGDYPNCIFVLGMEPGMVAAALEVANKDVIEKALEMGVADRTAPVGWRFMEKIVQLPIMIPPPTEDGRKAYVKSLVGSLEAAAPDRVEVAKEPPKEEEIQEFIRLMEGGTLAEVEKKSLDVVAAAPVEKQHAAAEAGKRVYARTFTERDPVISDFVKEVAELVDGNPRQIKRYVNVFRFYSTLRYGLQADGRATASELPSDKVLAKFVALTIQWPHAMDCLRVKSCLSAGKMVSRLEYLEAESGKIGADDVAGDESWKKIVDGIGSGMGTWAQTRTFRNFLGRGESLGRSGGHGLW
jgi:hypothetical protein